MLADAFAAERLRLSRAWGALFWALGFAPIVAILVGVGAALLNRLALQTAGGDLARLNQPSVDLGRAAAEAMTGSDLIPVQLLFMIAAATVFAVDYRWETWRLLTPRNTRANLILGKMAAFGLAIGAGLLLLALAGAIAALLGAAITGAPLGSSRSVGALLSQFAGTFLACWLEVLALGMLAACVAVVTRNGVATILAPVAIWLVQWPITERIGAGFPDPTNPPLPWLAALPALSADVMRFSVLGEGPGFTRPAVTPFAFLFVLLWIAALTALAIWLFRRQDLTRE